MARNNQVVVVEPEVQIAPRRQGIFAKWRKDPIQETQINHQISQMNKIAAQNLQILEETYTDRLGAMKEKAVGLRQSLRIQSTMQVAESATRSMSTLQMQKISATRRGRDLLDFTEECIDVSSRRTIAKINEVKLMEDSQDEPYEQHHQNGLPPYAPGLHNGV